MLLNLTYADAYLALNLDVIRDELDVSCYDVVPAAKQVLGERTGAISNGPAGTISFSTSMPSKSVNTCASRTTFGIRHQF